MAGFMKIRFVFLITISLSANAIVSQAQSPAIEWHKGFGTDLEEHIHEGWQTSDMGFIGIGQNEEVGGNRSNILVVKTDSAGTEEWITELGTINEWDVGICVNETDGGFIIGGGIYNASSESQERFLAKLDFNGNVVWQKTYPGTGYSAVRGIDIYENGDIIATGYTQGEEGGFVFINDEGEGFIMKTDNNGDAIWDKTISSPQGTKVRIEEKGTLAIASTKWVYTYDRDNQDVLLIITDSLGNEIAVHSYGAEKDDQCFDFDLTTDGGYIFTGHTRSYGVVNWDYLVIKADSAGNEEWVRTFGQPRGYNPRWIHDESYGVRATPDGGFIIAGGTGDEYSYYWEGHSSGSSDEWKAYLVKTDSNGNLLWEAVYPANSVGNNAAEFIALTEEGGYIVFTDTDSQWPPEPNNFGFMKIEPDTITVSNYYELTLTIEGEGEVFPRNKYQLKDSTLTLTATPKNGWLFHSWSGDISTTENPVNITPTDDITVQAIFKESTGIFNKREKLQDIVVYPNPANTENIKIQIADIEGEMKIKITDINGRLITCKDEFLNGNDVIELPFNNFSNGIYIITICSDNFTNHQKVLIQ